MKKTFRQLFAALIAFALLTCAAVPVGAESERTDISDSVRTDVHPLYVIDDVTLLVNGKEVDAYREYVKLYYNDDGFISAQIPVITLIEALGGRVFWYGEGKAVILYRGHLLFFDSAKKTLVDPLIWDIFGFSFLNLLVNPFAGGGPGVYENLSLPQEYICGHDGLLLLCAAVLNVRIINDVDAAAIRVELREQSVLARFFGIAWETIRDLAADDLRL